MMEVSDTDSLSPARIICSLSSNPFESESDQKSSHHPNSIAGGVESTGVCSKLQSLLHTCSPQTNGGIDGGFSPITSSRGASCASEIYAEPIGTSSKKTSKATSKGYNLPLLVFMALVESHTQDLYNPNRSVFAGLSLMAT